MRPDRNLTDPGAQRRRRRRSRPPRAPRRPHSSPKHAGRPADVLVPGAPLRTRRRGQRTVGCRDRSATRTCSHRDDLLVLAVEPDGHLGERHGRRDPENVRRNGKRWDRVDVSASVFRIECATNDARTPHTSSRSRARAHAFVPDASIWSARRTKRDCVLAANDRCEHDRWERSARNNGRLPHGMRDERRTDAAYLFKLTCACPRVLSRRLDLVRDARNVIAC